MPHSDQIKSGHSATVNTEFSQWHGIVLFVPIGSPWVTGRNPVSPGIVGEPVAKTPFIGFIGLMVSYRWIVLPVEIGFTQPIHVSTISSILTPTIDKLKHIDQGSDSII